MSSETFELQRVHPVFTVRDLGEAVSYYCEKLGFECGWRWGSPPVRAGVRCGSVEIQLVCDPAIVAAGPSVAYCQMTGVEAYFRACVERGAIVQAPLGERPWGMRDFRVLDPSGNRLGFGELSAPPPGPSRS